MTGDVDCERSREQQLAGLGHLMAIAREQAEGIAADEAKPRYPQTLPLPCPVADQAERLAQETSGYRAGRHRR